MHALAEHLGQVPMHSSEPLIRKLTSVGPVTNRDIKVLDCSHEERAPAGADLFSEGDSLGEVLFLRTGWAHRYRLLNDGRRQIVNVLVPGDLIGPFTPTAKQFAATLTPSSICRVSRADIARRMGDCPGFSAAVEALIASEFELLAERTVSLGRRNAKERIAFLLLEVYERLRRVGLVNGNSFELPLTQEVIGDALGLSVVHVNRTLRALREAKLATVGFGRATIHDLATLADVASAGEGSQVPAEEMTGIISLR
jgi:CRP-like cAMP-binding protein